jgi:uncharacterized membrane protein YgcG
MGSLSKSAFVVATIVSCIFTTSAMAEEWMASKLRGAVFVYENAEWQQIFRGHVVDSSNAIQTSPNARVIFTRGQESIDVRGDTRIRIRDRVGALNTVIEQDFGEISVDVEKKNVQHFAVKAPLLTAVVKGTKFTVKSDRSGGAAEIIVRRGRVEVQDNQMKIKVDVKSGQRVGRQASANAVMEVKGRGSIEPFVSMNSNQPIAKNVEELKAKMGLSNTPSLPTNAGGTGNVGNLDGVGNVGGAGDVGGASSAGASSGGASNAGSAGSSGSGSSSSGSGSSGGAGSAGNAAKDVVDKVKDKLPVL